MNHSARTIPDLMAIARGPASAQIGAIHRGLSSSLFTKMAEYVGMTRKGLAETLKLNVRTLQNRSGAERFKASESEKSLRVVRVFARAVDVLGSEDRARKWLVAPIQSLGNARPVDFLDTDVGTQEVLNVLNAIEWGVYL